MEAKGARFHFGTAVRDFKLDAAGRVCAVTGASKDGHHRVQSLICCSMPAKAHVCLAAAAACGLLHKQPEIMNCVHRHLSGQQAWVRLIAALLAGLCSRRSRAGGRHQRHEENCRRQPCPAAPRVQARWQPGLPGRAGRCTHVLSCCWQAVCLQPTRLPSVFGCQKLTAAHPLLFGLNQRQSAVGQARATCALLCASHSCRACDCSVEAALLALPAVGLHAVCCSSLHCSAVSAPVP